MRAVKTCDQRSNQQRILFGGSLAVPPLLWNERTNPIFMTKSIEHLGILAVDYRTEQVCRDLSELVKVAPDSTTAQSTERSCSRPGKDSIQAPGLQNLICCNTGCCGNHVVSNCRKNRRCKGCASEDHYWTTRTYWRQLCYPPQHINGVCHYAPVGEDRKACSRSGTERTKHGTKQMVAYEGSRQTGRDNRQRTDPSSTERLRRRKPPVFHKTKMQGRLLSQIPVWLTTIPSKTSPLRWEH